MIPHPSIIEFETDELVPVWMPRKTVERWADGKRPQILPRQREITVFACRAALVENE
jgi:hypothetical protein